mgnify:CR=1 FL=1
MVISDSGTGPFFFTSRRPWRPHAYTNILDAIDRFGAEGVEVVPAGDAIQGRLREFIEVVK